MANHKQWREDCKATIMKDKQSVEFAKTCGYSHSDQMKICMSNKKMLTCAEPSITANMLSSHGVNSLLNCSGQELIYKQKGMGKGKSDQPKSINNLSTPDYVIQKLPDHIKFRAKEEKTMY